jgi:hypothetical protein
VIASWPCPLPQGGTAPEYALAFDRSRPHRLLILPALFDEANKIRHQIAEVMRRLDGAGIDCFLPDLPDCNESLQALNEQTLESWRKAAMAAAAHFRTTRLLTIRAAAILAPPRLSGWRYGPTSGATALRALLRARQVAAREAGLHICPIAAFWPISSRNRSAVPRPGCARNPSSKPPRPMRWRRSSPWA